MLFLKRFGSLFFIVSVFALTEANAGTTIQLKPVCDGSGDRLLSGGPYDRTCPVGGKDCLAIITETPDLVWIKPIENGGWIARIKIKDLAWRSKGEMYPAKPADIQSFPKEEYKLRVIHSDEYPSLDNITIDMSNAQTIGDGTFDIFIPKTL